MVYAAPPTPTAAVRLHAFHSQSASSPDELGNAECFPVNYFSERTDAGEQIRRSASLTKDVTPACRTSMGHGDVDRSQNADIICWCSVPSSHSSCKVQGQGHFFLLPDRLDLL